MKKLDNVVVKNGFTYSLVARTEIYALYNQVDKEGDLVGHEMFKIKIGKAKEVFGTAMPERELYPSNDDFGSTAWSVGKDLDYALERFACIEDKFLPENP